MAQTESAYVIRLEISSTRSLYLQEIHQTLDCAWTTHQNYALYYSNYEKAERVSNVLNKIHCQPSNQDEIYCFVEEIEIQEEEEE